MNHKNRMAEIGFWAIPPAGTKARERIEARFENDRKNPVLNKWLKDRYNEAQALVAVQSVNGSGLFADQQLREYNNEYNNRVFNHSLWDLPGSFNVVEAFNKFLPPLSIFELRQERDHLFSFQSFIDWVTGGEIESDDLGLVDVLEEGVIYSFNSVDSPSSLCFSTSDGKEFGFASMSCIRFGGEVSLILLAGQKADLDVESEAVRKSLEGYEAFSHRPHIQPSDTLAPRAEPLIEGQDLWKTIVLLRFDTESKTIDARYVFKDCGQSYQGHTDDLDNYLNNKGEFIDDRLKDLYCNVKESIKQYTPLFELGKTCLLLPKYFVMHGDAVLVERHPTDFKEFRLKLKNKKIIEKVEGRFHIAHRDVYAYIPKAMRSPDRVAFIAPEYKIETSGFWKKLPLASEGRDKHGRQIHGRTWVSQTLSWVEEANASTSVVTKQNTEIKRGNNPGYIYVMRSAAHEKDVFKIGLTTRTTDVRANELSRSTSSPDVFLVVEEWATSDCILAEKMIHAKLDEFRINPSREYFKARYKEIFSAIDEVISEIDGA